MCLTEKDILFANNFDYNKEKMLKSNVVAFYCLTRVSSMKDVKSDPAYLNTFN